MTISLPTWKGLTAATPFPAASFLAWITTFTVSIGWMTDEAIQPDRDPIMKGFPIDCSKVYFYFFVVIR